MPVTQAAVLPKRESRRRPAPAPVIADDEVTQTAPKPRNAARPADHVSTAQQRELAQREPEHATPRVRRRKATVFEDEFSIPMDEIPDGLSYEWKRHSVNGQEDPFYLARMREQGWEPVPPSRHPTWVPPGYNLPHIIKGGQILMDRPKELTEEARAESVTLARKQVREAEQRLGKTGKGEMTRDFPGVEPRVEKQYMRPIPIEDD